MTVLLENTRYKSIHFKAKEATTYFDFGIYTEKGKQGIHIDKGLSCLSVHCSQEVQGKRKLE